MCWCHLPALKTESEHSRLKKENRKKKTFQSVLILKGTNWILACLKPGDLKVFPRYVFGPWQWWGPIKICRHDGLLLLFLKYIAPFSLRPTPAGGMSHFLLKRVEEGMEWGWGWGVGGGVGVDYIVAHKRGCGQIENNIKMKKHFSVMKKSWHFIRFDWTVCLCSQRKNKKDRGMRELCSSQVNLSVATLLLSASARPEQGSLQHQILI